MILGTAGHIDHGKTALVRALTGVDTDRLPEEKKRGITIDLGFAPLVIDGVGTIGIVDVPGHEAFIRTMLAGASGIDIALLVVAADEGVMPQTEEHLEILRLLGVERGLVALTKCDLVEAEWLDLQRDEVESLFSRSKMKPWNAMAVSAKSGYGIDSLKETIGRLANEIPNRGASGDFFRMPVDRAFSVKGTGTVVTGTVWSGGVTRDASLIVRPSGQTVRIRAIEHHGVAADIASAGERTALALAGVELSDVERGSVLVSEPEWTSSSEIDVMFQINSEDLRITSRTRLVFHLGTAGVEARFTGQIRNHVVGKSEVARLRLAEPVVSRSGDRFVLRMPSPARTIGGGIVLDPYPVPRSRRQLAGSTASTVAEQGASAASQLGRILDQAGTLGVSTRSLSIRTPLTPNQVKSELAKLRAIDLGSRQYSRTAAEYLMARIASIVSEGVANHSLEPGVSLQATRSAANASEDLVDWALHELVESGRIEIQQSLVRPAGWKPKLGDGEQGLSDSIMQEICKEPSQPPSVGELESRFGPKTRALVRKLEREGSLERVSDDRYYSSEAVRQIVDEMRARLEADRVYSPAELREVLGVSRKYLIPFLEFCDRKGVTERRLEGRSLRPTAAEGLV